MSNFGRISLNKDMVVSAINPTVNSDSTEGFAPLSRWINTTTKAVWTCLDATPGAAIWLDNSGGEQLLGHIKAANMNVTTDQPFIMSVSPTAIKFAVSKILVTNASLSLTTAAGGIYSAAAKGGTAIVAAAQAYAALTVGTSLLALTIAAAGSGSVWSVAPILSLTTAQGAAATADFYLFGEILPTFAS